MLVNYHNVVKKNICDYIPKIVITLLVKKTTEDCETVLIKNLYWESEIDSLTL
jgi:dynamin 1-like protein